MPSSGSAGATRTGDAELLNEFGGVANGAPVINASSSAKTSMGGGGGGGGGGAGYSLGASLASTDIASLGFSGTLANRISSSFGGQSVNFGSGSVDHATNPNSNASGSDGGSGISPLLMLGALGLVAVVAVVLIARKG